jgi:xylulose-5-phosphate/fructose-6-phosphate phosphoketolase
MPDFTDYAVPVPEPGRTSAEATRTLGTFLRDVMADNSDRFRVFGPDETASNRLDPIYEATKKTWLAEYLPSDADGGELAPNGRVMEILSEHTCLGWLEGYVLTGRHGLFNTYEAFVHIVDSMFNQHAKWLDVSKNEVSWRAPVSSANYLLSSHVWRQDHNGFSHQDPGFIDNVVNKRGDVIRVYLPPDANTLLSVADHCLRSTNYINVIVAGKQPALQYLDMDAAVKHCTAGLGIWEWATLTGDGPCRHGMRGDVLTLKRSRPWSCSPRPYSQDPRRQRRRSDDAQPAEAPHGLLNKEFDELTTSRPLSSRITAIRAHSERPTVEVHANLPCAASRKQDHAFDTVVRRPDRFSSPTQSTASPCSSIGIRKAGRSRRLVDHRTTSSSSADM